MQLNSSELHISLDLETLSKANNALVTEVGLCLFDPYADGMLGGSHSWLLQMEPQAAKGRDVSLDTIQWWLKQEDEARKKMTLPEGNRFPMEEFFSHFGHINWDDVKGLWANDLNFDITILESLFADFGRSVPWHYRAPRSYRTICWLADLPKDQQVKPTLAHSAESDAIAQALTVQKAFQRIHLWKTAHDQNPVF